jgi:hypothetical protein
MLSALKNLVALILVAAAVACLAVALDYTLFG